MDISKSEMILECNIYFVIFINILLLVTAGTYCVLKIQHYTEILPNKKNKQFTCILFFIVGGMFSVIGFMSLLNISIVFILAILVGSILMKLFFSITLKQCFFFSMDSVIPPLLTGGIILAFFRLIIKEISYYSITPYIEYIQPVIAFFIADLIVYILNMKKIKTIYWKYFLSRQKKLKDMLLIQIYIVIFLSITSLAYELNLNLWFWWILFSSYLCVLIIYEMLLNYIVRDSAVALFKAEKDLLEEEIKNYKLQSLHIYDIKKFKHDFQSLIHTMEQLLKLGKVEDTLVFLEQITQKNEKDFSKYKEFSNNQFIQAILNNAYQNAIKQKISFEANVPFPDYFNINELDLCRIFSNLINNAIEATSKLESGKREIKIYGDVKKQWFFLIVSNSFNGILKFKNDKIVTSKNNKLEHGLGLKIIEDIVNEYDGFMKLEFDEQKFVIKIYLPYKK